MKLFQCTKTPSKVSSKTTNIFDESFDTYADALYKYLDSKGIELKWLAEKTTPKGQKVKSTQEKFSTWKKDGVKPNKKIRSLIDDILDVSIEFNSNGKWSVRRAEKSKAAENNIYSKDQVFELLKEERSRYGIEDIPDTELGRHLQSALDDAVSLVLKIRRLIEMDRNLDE